MNKLLEALKNTVDQLKSNPYIIVDEANINKPATAEEIDKFEKISKILLPQNIKDFYLSANGLKCVWRIAQDVPAEIIDDMKRKGELPDFDYSQPIGAIRIFSVEEMLTDKYWVPPFQDTTGDQAFEFKGQEFTLGSFAKMLKIFDAYYVTNDFQCMAFVTGTTPENFYLLMLDDYFADWHNSRLVDFEVYIMAMCKTRFMISSRRKLFGKYRGDKDPILTDASMPQEDIEPALFK